MLAEDYPWHMGVTEAGEGEDAQMKSAICMGTLLQDGLGDTSGFPSQNKSTRGRDKSLQKTDKSFYGIIKHQIFSKRVMSLVVLEAPHMLVVFLGNVFSSSFTFDLFDILRTSIHNILLHTVMRSIIEVSCILMALF